MPSGEPLRLRQRQAIFPEGGGIGAVKNSGPRKPPRRSYELRYEGLILTALVQGRRLLTDDLDPTGRHDTPRLSSISRYARIGGMTMALETSLQAILRTMRERSPPSNQWEYSQQLPRYLVTARSGKCGVAFFGTSPLDIALVYMIDTVSRAEAAVIEKLNSELVVVIDQQHGDRFGAKTTVVDSGRGPYTIRVCVDGPEAADIAAAVACAASSTDFGLYAGPESLAYRASFRVDGALLAFASFFAGCHPN